MIDFWYYFIFRKGFMKLGKPLLPQSPRTTKIEITQWKYIALIIYIYFSSTEQKNGLENDTEEIIGIRVKSANSAQVKISRYNQTVYSRVCLVGCLCNRTVGKKSV